VRLIPVTDPAFLGRYWPSGTLLLVITQDDARRIARGKLSNLERPVTITRVIDLEDQWEVHWDSPGYDPNEVEGVPIGNPLLVTKQGRFNHSCPCRPDDDKTKDKISAPGPAIWDTPSVLDRAELGPAVDERRGRACPTEQASRVR
jgi:hypothetical protein